MRLGCSALTVVAFAVVCAIASASAQQSSHKATVTTKKGETIEGTFKSATETEIVLEVAGQTLRLPLAAVRTISFVGRVEEATTSQKPRPVDDAFKALSDLAMATEIGVLREQYSAKLLETLPRVKAFIDSLDGSCQ
ncbi:MAG: hypothetical protein IMZ71_04700 [Chloroflexi bacterium]|nr:hypothetical protein [Chloroflexota bacterium]